MVSLEKRLVPWLGFVGDLLGEPLDHLPHEAVFHQLLASFPATGASFNWSQPGGQLGVITHPRSFLEQYQELFGVWRRGEVSGQHPLETWYLTSGDMRPNTCARVPTTLVSRRDHGFVMKALQDMEMEQQLSIHVPTERWPLPGVRDRSGWIGLHRRRSCGPRGPAAASRA